MASPLYTPAGQESVRKSRYFSPQTGKQDRERELGMKDELQNKPAISQNTIEENPQFDWHDLLKLPKDESIFSAEDFHFGKPEPAHEHVGIINP